MVKKANYSSSVDAGYGLIYRLNDLWNGADRAALAGDLDKWNHVLNAIFRNLCYRGSMEIAYEDKEKTKIKEIKLNEEDSTVFYKFQELIRQTKIKIHEAIKIKNRGNYNKVREELHLVLSQKDVWLRKFMQERGLYLREVEFDPSQAMWGG